MENLAFSSSGGGVRTLSPFFPDAMRVFKASALWAVDFYKSKCPCVYVSIRVFTFEVLFKRLFAPTSQNWMSDIFRDLESLGENNKKKWSQIGKLLLIKGVKSQGKK